MKATIIPIGNLKGIRIPKAILEQCHIEKEVFLEMKGENIIIKPIKKQSRKGWEKYFKKMKENKLICLKVLNLVYTFFNSEPQSSQIT